MANEMKFLADYLHTVRGSYNLPQAVPNKQYTDSQKVTAILYALEQIALHLQEKDTRDDK